jgi:hypothetical protein
VLLGPFKKEEGFSIRHAFFRYIDDFLLRFHLNAEITDVEEKLMVEKKKLKTFDTLLRPPS